MWSPAKELSVYIWFLFLEKAYLIFRKCTRHYHNVIIATCAKNIPRYKKSWDYSLQTLVFWDRQLTGRIEWHATHFYLSNGTSTASSFNLLFTDMCLLVWRHEILLLHSTWHVRLTKLFSSKSNHRVVEDVHIITTNSEKAGNTRWCPISAWPST